MMFYDSNKMYIKNNLHYPIHLFPFDFILRIAFNKNLIENQPIYDFMDKRDITIKFDYYIKCIIYIVYKMYNLVFNVYPILSTTKIRDISTLAKNI